MLTIFFHYLVAKSIFLLETVTFNLTKQVSTSCIPGNLDGFLSLDKILCFRESFVSNNITTFISTMKFKLSCCS